MVKFRDYYETLGLRRGADEAEIKKAYRKLARKYHPDINREKDAESRFKEISEAYEVLGDPEKRKKYDSLGQNWKNGQEFRAPPGQDNVHYEFYSSGPDASSRHFSFEDFGEGSDFFESLFGSVGGKRKNAEKSRWTPPPLRGQDVEADIDITLEEAFRGTERRMGLQVMEMDENGRLAQKTKNIDFRIPPGTTQGSRIRLKGKGGAGVSGGENGDLFLRIHIRPHPEFKVRGHNLETELLLTPWEAALGTKAAISTLEGKTSIAIQPGTQSGQKIRLKEKGLPIRNKGCRGDIFIIVNIRVPERLSAREKELFEKLAAESNYNPRA